MAAFKFFHKRGRDQENDESSEKLHGGEATEFEGLQHRVH
jgi:hypothetical protein